MSSTANGTNGHPRTSTRGDAFDRLPPQSLEAEMGVLGSMLLDPETIPEVVEALRPEDFYRDSHGMIFRAIRDLDADGRPVDALTLAEELTRRGEYAEVGGDEALAKALESVPHAANASYYAAIVKAKATTRALVEHAAATLRAAYSGLHSAEDLLADAERRLADLLDTGRPRGTTTIAEATARAMERVRARRRGEAVGVMTGFRDIDDMLGGLQPGQMVVIAARPGMGKSAMAANICEHAAAVQGIPTLLASAEMSASEIGERMLAARARLNTYLLRNAGLLKAEELARLESCQAAYEGVSLAIDDSGVQTASRLAGLARGHRRRPGGLGLVVVDYVQILATEDVRGESRQEQVAKISRRLKALAMDLGIPVIALSQLNRLAEQREDKRPRLADLRETGALEQDADAVILLHRPEYYDPNDQPGVAEAIVAKNRNGQTGTIRLAWLGPTVRFANFDDRQGPVIDAGNF